MRKAYLIALFSMNAPNALAEPAPTDSACSYAQPSVKICSTKDGKGAFEAFTTPPAVVYIVLDEPITHVIQPPSKYFKTASKDNSVTIAPLQKDFPDRTPVVITAGPLTVTVVLRQGTAEKSDVQLIIKDPDRGSRDVEIDRRVDEKIGPREKALDEREKALEKRAEARANEILLEDLAHGGIDVRSPAETDIARNAAAIIIHGHYVVRIGGKRFLVLSVENRGPEDFQVRSVRVWMNERELKGDWKFDKTTIAPGQDVRGAVLLPLSGAHSSKARFRVVVEEADKDRNVELGDIEVR